MPTYRTQPSFISFVDRRLLKICHLVFSYKYGFIALFCFCFIGSYIYQSYQPTTTIELKIDLDSGPATYPSSLSYSDIKNDRILSSPLLTESPANASSLLYRYFSSRNIRPIISILKLDRIEDSSVLIAKLRIPVSQKTFYWNVFREVESEYRKVALLNAGRSATITNASAWTSVYVAPQFKADYFAITFNAILFSLAGSIFYIYVMYIISGVVLFEPTVRKVLPYTILGFNQPPYGSFYRSELSDICHRLRDYPTWIFANIGSTTCYSVEVMKTFSDVDVPNRIIYAEPLLAHPIGKLLQMNQKSCIILLLDYGTFTKAELYGVRNLFINLLQLEDVFLLLSYP